MTMGLYPPIERGGNRKRESMFSNKWVVLIAALIVWTAYFHTMDWMIMEAQGLPVKFNLMPR